MAYATGRHMAQGFFSYAYEADEVAAMVREVYKGRVRFHDGDAELAPGVSLHRIGGPPNGAPAACGPPPDRRVRVAPDRAPPLPHTNTNAPLSPLFHAR